MKKWETANGKMERILSIHRRRGMIHDETAESEALQYVIPAHVKFLIVADLVRALRREFVLSLDDIKKKKSSQTSFSTSDAIHFLQRKQTRQNMTDYGGTMTKIGKPTDKGGRSKAARVVLQFVFFRKMNKNNILDSIMAYHEDVGTFSLSTEARDCEGRIQTGRRAVTPEQMAHARRRATNAMNGYKENLIEFPQVDHGGAPSVYF
jgi:NADH dehydrogenase/NADH:ubiquinone oxidoreductase subunit G